MAKTLIIVGVIFILIGGCVYLFAKVPGFGKMPGDILIKKDNFTFYFPLATCLLISVLFSLILFFLNQK